MTEPKLIYLATPYSHPIFEIRKLRYELINQIAARLMEQGNGVFSPISHSHPIELHMGEDAQTWDFWQKQDIPILRACTDLYLVKVWGWKESVGCKGEIEFAEQHGIPVTYVDPLDYVHPIQYERLRNMEFHPLNG